MVRNVVLLCLDTVRKDFFDKYATRVQEISDVSFMQCRSVSSWTIPSHGSIFTGELPHEHGIHTYNIDFSSLDREDTFLGSLTEHNLIGVSANPFLSERFGFSPLFDKFSSISPKIMFGDGWAVRHDFNPDSEGWTRFLEFILKSMSHDSPAKSFINGIYGKAGPSFRRLPLPRLKDDGAKFVKNRIIRECSTTEEPFFVYGNFMDAHGPFYPMYGYDSSLYSAPNSWSSEDYDLLTKINIDEEISDNRENIRYYRELYSAAIDYLDRIIHRLINRIQNETELETTIIVTADHGENLVYRSDEHLFEHKSSLTEGLLHVPCVIINPPKGYDENEYEYFSQLNFGDLITKTAFDERTDKFSKQIPAELMGMGLWDPDVGHQERRYWNRIIRCVYTSERKVVWDSLGNNTCFELDLGNDNYQQKSSESICPSNYDSIFEVDISDLAEKYQKSRSALDMDDATMDRLEELGYV